MRGGRLFIEATDDLVGGFAVDDLGVAVEAGEFFGGEGFGERLQGGRRLRGLGGGGFPWVGWSAGGRFHGRAAGVEVD